MKESVLLTFSRYKDDKGKPACGLSPKDTCTFLRFTKFGQRAVCLMCDETHTSHRGEPAPLRRRGKDGLGYLIPGTWCPLWEKQQ